MDSDDRRRLFDKLYDCLRDWDRGQIGLRDQYIGWLLRGEATNLFFNGEHGITDEELRWCQLLIGERGYTVLKMLEARKGIIHGC